MDTYLPTDLQEYLEKKEKLIWTGQPKKGIVFRTADILLIPFSLLWCGFAIKSGLFRKTVKSLNIKTLSDIEYHEKKDGSGTINIGPKNPMMMWFNGMNWWPGMKPTPSLDLIQDVRKVYNKIIEIQQSK